MARRCAWADASELLGAYHDKEWGVPSHEDSYLFEMLLLESAQAGLSWSTILAKRDNYRRALDGFDVERISRYGEDKLASLLGDPGIVRNRLKVRSTVANARAFLAVREEYETFALYLWGWVDGSPVIHRPTSTADLPSRSDLSDRISKDLKRWGFTFVGSTILYAYLQAVGIVDDHVVGCPAKPNRPE
jgi:DNA-3-methyladenine glycosylase I